MVQQAQPSKHFVFRIINSNTGKRSKKHVQNEQERHQNDVIDTILVSYF